jgi:hypothetical protein
VLPLSELRLNQRLLVRAAIGRARAVAGPAGALVVVLLVVALLAGACGTSSRPQPQFRPGGSGQAELRLDISDNGRTIGIPANSEFTVTLSTEDGRAWLLTQPPDPGIASVVSSRIVRALEASVQVWTFRAVGPGTTTIEMMAGAVPSPSDRSSFRLIVSVT